MPSGIPLLEALHRAGIRLNAPCGGMGTCGACRVRLVTGLLSPPSKEELRLLGRERLAAGERLACRARILEESILFLPADSLSTPQRSQVEIRLQAEERIRGAGNGLGIAFDAGTTGLAAYLADLEEGKVLRALGAPNPQTALGEDVITRIRIASEDSSAADRLRALLAQALAELSGRLLEGVGRDPGEVERMVLVGNPAMTHLFLGLPVESLGKAPYMPASRDPLEVPAPRAGLPGREETILRIPPAVAGFVGADHLAALLASGILEAPGPAVLMDIGTNTEVALVSGGSVRSCSTASGPAFEGAGIRCGMRAAPGAVERITMDGGRISFSTIEGRLPLGICGSGILDALACLAAGGYIEKTGRFREPGDPRLVRGEGGPRFELVPPAFTGHGDPVFLSRKDIHQVQAAKAAMRAGLDVLLHEAGLEEGEIQTFFLAGAFGTYLDVESALRVGMVPPIGSECFRQIGNAAGAGALAMLSDRAWNETLDLAERIQYVELAGTPRFTDAFTDRLLLPVESP